MLEKHPILARLTLGLLFTILFLYALVAVRGFLYPIMLAVLVSFMLYPLAWGMEKRGVPRILANLISILFGIAVVAGVVFFLYNQIRVFMADLPRMKAQANENLNSMFRFVEQKIGVTVADQAEWLDGALFDLFFSGEGAIIQAITGTADTLIRLLLIPVYVFFLLYYRNKFKFFILRLTPIRYHEKAEAILLEVSHVTKRYMTGISLVVLILCFLNSLGLIIVGIRFPIMLGIISAFMNFFPYIGTWMGGIIPLTLALLTEDSPKYALGVFILFVIIQFIENNILTPNIVGSQVQINPFFVILSLVVGAMLWGLPGMFLILPYLGMFKVVADNIEPLHPYAYLLDPQGTERHSLTIDKIKQVFGWRKQQQD
jgi:predicted PurR-regulated permease PerM